MATTMKSDTKSSRDLKTTTTPTPYVNIKQIGSGSYGAVYRAENRENGKELAVKINYAELHTTSMSSLREMCNLTKLKHPYIVEALGFVHKPFNPMPPLMVGDKPLKDKRYDDLHFIFDKAEFDLHAYIYEMGLTDPSVYKRFMADILMGMEYLHSQKYVHRDIKPANIIIFNNGKRLQAKICDLGLTKPYTYQGVQTPNTVSYVYRAPEISLGNPNHDYKVDIWSIGCVFYQMITKRRYLDTVQSFPTQDETDDDILSTILGIMEQKLDPKLYREYIVGHKWRKIKLSPKAKPVRHISLKQRIGLKPKDEHDFNKMFGSYDEFINLLQNMLRFEWDKRYDAKQCLEHPFFKEYQEESTSVREKYNISTPEEPLNITYCKERKWMAEFCAEIYNKGFILHHEWFSYRVIFMAVRLFDEYISYMFTTPDCKDIETEERGRIHSKNGTRFKFYCMLYTSVKYFTTSNYSMPYESIFPKIYDNIETRTMYGQFENEFIIGLLKSKIYKNTIYETADSFNEYLDHGSVDELIMMYLYNTNLSGHTPSEIYEAFRKAKRDPSKPDVRLINI